MYTMKYMIYTKTCIQWSIQYKNMYTMEYKIHVYNEVQKTCIQWSTKTCIQWSTKNMYTMKYQKHVYNEV